MNLSGLGAGRKGQRRAMRLGAERRRERGRAVGMRALILPEHKGEAAAGKTRLRVQERDGRSDQICEAGVGVRNLLVMFETVSAYSAIAFISIHLGWLRKASQCLLCASASAADSM